jgi:hypothetical protein
MEQGHRRKSPAHNSDLEPAIRDGDLYQPMWPELEALVGSARRAANLLAERSPLLPSDGLRRSIAQVRVP